MLKTPKDELLESLEVQAVLEVLVVVFSIHELEVFQFVFIDFLAQLVIENHRLLKLDPRKLPMTQQLRRWTHVFPSFVAELCGAGVAVLLGAVVQELLRTHLDCLICRAL